MMSWREMEGFHLQAVVQSGDSMISSSHYLLPILAAWGRQQTGWNVISPQLILLHQIRGVCSYKALSAAKLLLAKLILEKWFCVSSG